MAEKTFFNDLHRRFVHHAAAQRLHRIKQEALLAQIRRLAGQTGARFQLVADYAKRLEEPLRISQDFVNTCMRRIPGPIVLNPQRWDAEPHLNAVFLDAAEIQGLLAGATALKTLFAEQAVLAHAFGLLVARLRQKTVFGVDQKGDILVRDVARKSVYFEDHLILAVGASLAHTHEKTCYEALAALVVRTLKEIKGLKQWKAELEKQHEMLELLVRLPVGQPEEAQQQRQAKQVLDRIHDQLDRLDTGIGSPEDQLARMVAVLASPEHHLKMRSVQLRINRMGIEVDGQTDEPVNDIALAEFSMDEEQRRVAFWVQVDRQAMG